MAVCFICVAYGVSLKWEILLAERHPKDDEPPLVFSRLGHNFRFLTVHTESPHLIVNRAAAVGGAPSRSPRCLPLL